MANSSLVVVGDTLLAAQYNNLREDSINISTGHKHTGAVDDGHGLVIGVHKASDEEVVNSTYQDDDELLVALPINTVWKFNMVLLVKADDAGGAGGFKTKWALPSGASGEWWETGDEPATTPSSIHQDITVGFTFSSLSDLIERLKTWSGRITMSSTSGNSQLQWAQNSTSASGVHVAVDSYVVFTRIS